MSVTQKLRWMRLVNEMRYIHEESEIVSQVISQGEKEFYEYYRRYADRENMDIEALNQSNSARVQELYSPAASETPQLCEVTGSITLYQGTPTPENRAPTQYEMTKDEREIHDCFNRLFKSIAMKIHPDKISNSMSKEERSEYIRMFKEATNALENHKYFILLDMAATLKIPQPKNYRQQTRWMKKEIHHLKAALVEKKNMYTYLFCECESDGDRDALIRRFINQLFGILPANNA